MNTELIVTYIVLGVLAIGIVWGFVKLLKITETIGELEKQNPLVENEALKAFVYIKPKMASSALAIEVSGTLEVKDVVRSEYYLLVAKGSSDDAMFSRVKNIGGYIMLLGQCFKIEFDKLVVRDGIEHTGYVLTLLDKLGLDRRALKDASFNTRVRYHIMLL